ncbi:MAG TPA: lysophospholipid acyltransferase family protein [Polyangia bacterium]|nr:lysophospholipid acyltransferase family protein [Polyangia bacterium]
MPLPRREALDQLWRILSVLLREVPPRDVLAILFPPALGYEILKGRTGAEPLPSGDYDPSLPDPALFGPVLEFARWLSVNWFHASVWDAERVPAEGPVLLVGNHSAGLMPVDALFAIDAIQKLQGPGRAVHPLVHDFAFQAPRMALHARRMGILRAGRENAAAALADGRIVLVYPGGDRDAFRSFHDRNRIVLAGRTGFVELAMAHGVPIVPLVSVGLHESLFVVTSGERIAERLDLKRRLRTEVLPLALMFPWGLAPAAMPFLPLPTDIEMRFGEPIAVEGEPGDEAAVAEGYRRVETAMQAMMDELSAGRTPIFGRAPSRRTTPPAEGGSLP